MRLIHSFIPIVFLPLPSLVSAQTECKIEKSMWPGDSDTEWINICTPWIDGDWLGLRGGQVAPKCRGCPIWTAINRPTRAFTLKCWQDCGAKCGSCPQTLESDGTVYTTIDIEVFIKDEDDPNKTASQPLGTQNSAGVPDMPKQDH
ncbi:MAG: hypothetical protein M1829_004096 [Trizodia sp. TS-e1964]|nr:MAG: hypothetical protein M1829_004096 [Trizodia sp. TS-e1964]